MTSFRAAVLAALAGLVALSTATLARADGNVSCQAGSPQTWQAIDKLKKVAWLERWEVLKVQVEGDCYEVYARTEQGQAIEAFFHPVSLKKLVVFRRGKEIWRAPGFTG